MKAISPLIVTVVIVAVVIAISITYALWITFMTTSTIQQKSVKLEFYDAKIAVKTLILYIKNTGATETTITHVIVNNQEAKIVWAWDLTDNKYLGYGKAPIKPGHMVEIAVKTEKFQFTPGVFVDFKILTSSGITLYRTIELTAHPVLSYIHGGYLNAYDFDPNYFAAVYHEYWNYTSYIGKDLRFGAGIKSLSLRFNMWYGLFQLEEDNTIIAEFYISGSDETHIGLMAHRNGTIIFYDNIPGNQPIYTGFNVYDPHNILFNFTVHSNNIVELKLYIDNKLVVDRNYTNLYNDIIGNICFGVWDDSGLYDTYIDNIVEKIIWTNSPPTIVEEDFDDLATDYFTSFVSDAPPYDPSNPVPITSYPIILNDGKIGFVIDHT